MWQHADKEVKFFRPVLLTTMTGLIVEFLKDTNNELMYNLREIVMEQCETKNNYSLTSSQLTTFCIRTLTNHIFMLSNSNVLRKFHFSSPNVMREQYEKSHGWCSYLPSVNHLSQLPPMYYYTTWEVIRAIVIIQLMKQTKELMIFNIKL